MLQKYNIKGRFGTTDNLPFLNAVMDNINFLRYHNKDVKI